MASRYVTDIIGDDYKNWKPGSRILITNGTGSGKTFFVLNTLLRYARAHGKHLVYFCNRKYLSLQVQSVARKLLLNELGEDVDDLAGYLHIRTYQFAERAYDYPDIHALNEDGSVIRDAIEVHAHQIMFYVFDEAFYMVSDAGFNPNTHYWYDTAQITENKNSVSVFLAATPEPFLLYLKFMHCSHQNLMELCKQFIAMDRINSKHISCEQRMRWMYYYWPGLREVEKHRDSLKQNTRTPFSNSAWMSANESVNSIIDQVTKDAKNPYRFLFQKVEDAYNLEDSGLTYVYQDERSLTERYGYLDTFYFDDMATLAKHIASSVRSNREKEATEENKRRWIVFVRKFEEATALRISLRALDCKSVAISSRITRNYDGSPGRRKGSVKKILETLVHEEKLDCDVLISTSVLDCGISLKNATDMAVCQPDKTSFLQMIGRIRVKENQRVNLYIQSFTPKEIKGHREMAEKMFLHLSKVYVMEESVHKSVFGYKGSVNPDMERFFAEFVRFLPEATYEGLKVKLENDPKKKHYMYKVNRGQNAWQNNKNPKLQLNNMALLHYLNQVYFAREELPVYAADPYYFLKVQLSWLGKAYDPEKWIDYQSSREPLFQYLEERSMEFEAKNPMDKAAQFAFRKKCFVYLSSVRNPPDSFLKAKKRHAVGSADYPGKSKLNEIFTDMGIPYRIESKQDKTQRKDKKTGMRILDPKNGKPQIDDKSYWYLISVDAEKELPKLEAKREEKRIKQAERKAENAQKKAQQPAVERSTDPDNPLGVFINNYPKNARQVETDKSEHPEKEVGTLKIQIMRGDKTWSPDK